ncbi:carboxymuconolactone decarboxylase family protein [Paenibacillus radicis (ex Gao et al. 2016)]|uniref:Alkyl hydroperoxide reductase AhpD n=1 Tax=Paenibacillus radicis (ex Gao et al. 2016) TaxID=1737354 RepID=A0A917H744_9BACL|nr:carboxymuconolactone decarboxylase family protein [Paenibacillus radicis (ex Gao et al. 2016)]GGG69238.1 alkyl hydroperoxide reductase AhpD [Paenibacillus radicis (ex Gao et al. 2016)]
MKVRFNHISANPGAMQTMLKLEGFIQTSGLDSRLYELIKLRASQINGCAYCLDMHTRESRKMGETEQRIHLLHAWREAPFYSEKERAVLELTEAVTRISEQGVPQDLYERVRTHIDEAEYVTIIMAINTINAWNRIAISTGMFPETETR